MRKLTAICAVAVCLAFSAIVSTARGDEPVVEKQDVKSVAVSPIATPRDGKNVSLTLEVKPATSKRLPRGLGLGLNGKPLDLVGDGSWPDATAGDGIYTIGLKTNDGKPLKEGGSLRLSSEPAFRNHATPIGCTFKSVPCPPHCKSLVFRAKCVVCLELVACTIGN